MDRSSTLLSFRYEPGYLPVSCHSSPALQRVVNIFSGPYMNRITLGLTFVDKKTIWNIFGMICFKECKYNILIFKPIFTNDNGNICYTLKYRKYGKLG